MIYRFYKSNKEIFVIGIIMFCLLYCFYGDILISPNSYLFSADGDGIKNYFTYNFYIQNNHSWTNFEGMNYPYGEHFLYTDCTPIVAVTIRLLQFVIPGVANYSIGILNSLIFTSFFLAAVFLYLLFKELKIQTWLAISSAIAYTFLCPQVFRMTGHLALSFTCFLPISIYYLYKFEHSSKEFKHYLLLSILLLFWLFIHAYLGVILFLFLFLFFLTRLILGNIVHKKLSFKSFIYHFGFLVLPLLLFNIFVYLTDNHKGRTDNPFGFFSFYTDIKYLFIPTNGPISRFISKYVVFDLSNWEALSYVGILSIFSILFILYKVVEYFIRFKKVKMFSMFQNDSFVLFLLISAFLVLLFAMCIPFRFHLEFLIDYLKVLKQFRALGRFAWVFYFVIAIVSVYILNSFLINIEKKSKMRLKQVLIFSIILITFFEGKEYHNANYIAIIEHPNTFSDESYLNDLKGIKSKIVVNEFQAIIPLPYFYIGSENFWIIPKDSKLVFDSKMASFHLSLPLMSAFLTRTSIPESKNLVQMLSNPFYNKLIQKDLQTQKDFLLIVSDTTLLSENEMYFLQKSKLLFKGKQHAYYRLSFSALFENTAIDEYKKFKAIKKALYNKNHFLVSDTTSYFEYFNFDEDSNTSSKSGRGSKTGNIKGFTEIASFTNKELKPNRSYIIRFWAYNKGGNFGQDKLRYSLFVQETKRNEVKWITDIVSPMNSGIIDGDWSLVELNFTTSDSNESTYQLYLNGDENSKLTFLIDDLLIYESGNIIYKTYYSQNHLFLFKNSHRIRLRD
ncbi:MAG: hypothetical protein HYR91_04440 [Flavobacteriia bacterium]|nr:hypothetical protein [Flavobacteriia bacterium]